MAGLRPSTDSTVKLSDCNAVELSINMGLFRRRLLCQSLSDGVGSNLLIKHHLLICYNNSLA